LTDGESPFAALVQATNGNFYGTTEYGGASPGANCAPNCGTVFEITANGKLTTLHSFNGTDGFYIVAGLVQATDGNFYGTAFGGGTNSRGTVFKITQGGTLTTLYSFCSQSGCTDGYGPEGLVQASNGNFYGITNYGGANSCGTNSCGTVFEITPSGTLTTLHSFNGTDGQFPVTALIQSTDGNFYGTTYKGGANGDGTIFKITPSGTLTTLYSFCSQSGCPDGQLPLGALVQATNGNFYGTTEFGGTNGYGTVFSLSLQ
jgi:uncharacterized repeat protein (TIGR03803 family)